MIHPPGTRIGKYEVVKELGRGAMGVVYVGHDPDLDRRVALKVMAANIQQDTELSLRFRKEAQAVAKLQSPNIVTVYDFGYHESSPYFAMELVKGSDLESRLRQSPPNLTEKLNIVIQVCQGLDHAHKQGVIHRDIKPANIFVSESGLVKIMDFGTARLVQSNQTQTGTVMGTVAYMSPEQLKGEKVDGRSDLFSLGVVLYRLLCHQQPFPGENIHNIIYKILHVQPANLALPAGVQVPPLQLIVDRALTKDVDRRYPSAEAMAEDLNSFLRQHTGSLAEDTVFRTVTAGAAPPAAMTTDHRTMPVGGSPTMPVVSSETQQVAMAGTQPAAALESDVLEGATVITNTTATGSHAARSVAAVAKPQRRWLPWVAGAALLLLVAAAAFFLRPDATDPATDATSVDSVATTPGGDSGGDGTDSNGGSLASVETPATEDGSTTDPEEASTAGGDTTTQIADTTSGGTPAVATPPPPQQTQPAPVTPPPSSPPPPAPPPPRNTQAADAARLAQTVTRQEGAIRAALQSRSLDRAQELIDEGRGLDPNHPAWEMFEADLSVATTNREGSQALATALDHYEQGRFNEAIQASEQAKSIFDRSNLLQEGNSGAFEGRRRAIDLIRDAERSLEEASRPAAPTAVVARRQFQHGDTQFSSDSGGGPSGFQVDDSVQAQQATRSVTTPADIIVEISPENVAIGDPYRLSIRLHNRSNSALLAKSIEVVTLHGDREVGRGQPQDLKLRRIDPQSTSTLMEGSETWSEALDQGGLMEVTVELARKGTLRKTVRW